jgi:hypothetical protein
MKSLSKLALAAVLFAATFAAQAGTGHGYGRSSGSLGGYSSSRSSYVYRNPYAAYPSVNVRSYYRSSGTYVAPSVRTSPNWTRIDNLNYRGYGTIRTPKY